MEKMAVIVSSWEGIEVCINAANPLIQVDDPYYSHHHREIDAMMQAHGYEPLAKKRKFGMLFRRCINPHRFDPETDNVHDPYGCL